MEELSQLSSSGAKKLHVQGHTCETPDDIERMLEVHTEFKTYGEMYKAHGLMHEKSIMAHCIHLTKTDMGILKETKAGIAHNPNSNTCLRDGMCRVRELLNRGINVGLEQISRRGIRRSC